MPQKAKSQHNSDPEDELQYVHPIIANLPGSQEYSGHHENNLGRWDTGLVAERRYLEDIWASAS